MHKHLHVVVCATCIGERGALPCPALPCPALPCPALLADHALMHAFAIKACAISTKRASVLQVWITPAQQSTQLVL